MTALGAGMMGLGIRNFVHVLLDTGIPGCVKTIFDFKMWGHVSFNVHFNDTHPYNVIIYQWKWGNFLFYGLNFEFSHSLIRQYDGCGYDGLLRI